MQEITAVYIRERLRFQNADGDTIIGDIRLANGSGEIFSDSLPTAVKGKADNDELQPHQTYRFYGHGWNDYTNKRTNQTEHQFEFQTFIRSQPHGRAGVISYLKQAGRGHGIGQARATTLWEKFGSDAVRILREDPEIAVAAVTGLSVDQAKESAAWLQDEAALEGCTIDLIDLLTGHGFPKDTARKAVKLWGNRAAEAIKRDPYRLMSFRGVGFKRADALWMELGLSPTKLRRQALCAWYTISSETSGHTWYPVDFCVQGLRQQIGGANLRPATAIKLAKRIGRLSLDRNGALSTMRTQEGKIVPKGGILWIAEGRKAWCEDKLAELVVDARTEIVQWPKVEDVQGIDDHQRDQLRTALTGTVAILGGSPGTGKTYTAAALLSACCSLFGVQNIVVGCPTGKAAVRITEAIQSPPWKIPIRARTWHSLLGIGEAVEDSGNWGFKHHEGEPWPYRVLIGDESSMIDSNLMSSIFRARPAGCHLLLVGDVNQLPPVGHGAPLRDMIAAGLPYGELREIKRNSGGIVEACAAIRDGKKWGEGDNLQIFEHSEPEWQIKRILQLLETAKDDGFNPVWDCQIVVPVNDKSKVSRRALNKILQAELNRNPALDGTVFRLRDKICNLKNGWFSIVELCNITEDTEINDRNECYCANGELAEVIDVQEKSLIARLSNPTRIIRIPRGRQREESQDSQDDATEENSDKSSTGCSWDLAYALSVHKSQGSEWPIVIVVVDEYPGARMVCDRSWIYTAISRAKQRCAIVGNKVTADRFCREQKMSRRKTFLKELIALKAAERTLVEL